MKPKCGRKTRSGNPCARWPVAGADVCPTHGGRAPAVKAKGAARVAEQRARAAVAKMDIEPVSDPLTALSLVAGELLMVKDWLRGRVDLIKDDQMRSPDAKGTEQMRAEFTAYTAALNSCVATLATIVKLGLEERLVRVTEQQKTMVIESMRRGFAAAGVTGEAFQVAQAATVRHLRVLAGGASETRELTAGGELS